MLFGNKLYIYTFNNSLSSKTWEASQRLCPLLWDRQWNKRADDTRAHCSMHPLLAQSSIISPWHGDKHTPYLTPRLNKSPWGGNDSSFPVFSLYLCLNLCNLKCRTARKKIMTSGLSILITFQILNWIVRSNEAPCQPFPKQLKQPWTSSEPHSITRIFKQI